MSHSQKTMSSLIKWQKTLKPFFSPNSICFQGLDLIMFCRCFLFSFRCDHTYPQNIHVYHWSRTFFCFTQPLDIRRSGCLQEWKFRNLFRYTEFILKNPYKLKNISSRYEMGRMRIGEEGILHFRILNYLFSYEHSLLKTYGRLV